MDNDISVDAVGISPRHPEDQTNTHPQTFQDRNSFPIKDQQEQNNYLPPDTRITTYSPEQHGYYQSQSENDSEAINITQERHMEELKDLGDLDIAHTKDESEIKIPQFDLSMPETQGTQLPRVGNYDNQGRQVHTSNHQKKLCLRMSPSLDWRLNELLDCIATNVDEKELKRIKLMFTDPNGIGKGVFEKCDSLAFFTVLKQRGYISRNNILYLELILCVLQRRDLLQKTVEYCMNEGDVIHNYYVDRGPDVREKQIKVQVKADIQNYYKEQLDRLRNVVASIACIPDEEILISAVEPGSSFIIIFTMPEMYAEILQSMLQKKVNIQGFTIKDVDIMMIDDKQYDVTVNVPLQQRLNEMWQRTGEKEKLYEGCETICQLFESLPSSIIHVWPAYDTKANDDIVFVILTKSIEDKLQLEKILVKIRYNIFVTNVDSTRKESEAVLQKLDKLKENPLTYSQKEDIKDAIKRNADQLLQNHQYLSAISGSNVRSKNFMIEQSKHCVPFQPCIVLYVIAKGKIPLHESKFENHIDGIPVDVREGVFETTTLPSQKYVRPVQMGCQITSNETSPSYGTLGGFYYHSDLGLCGITCAHVVLNEDNMHKLRGEKQVLSSTSPMVSQPDTTRPRHQLGHVKEVVYRSGNENSSGIDMAIFKLEDKAPKSGHFPEEPDIGFETGRTLGTSGLRSDTQVLKYGRTTGLTRGYIEFEETTVRSLNYDRKYTINNVKYTYLLKNQIEIRPDISESPQFKLFNDGGDSGAFVFAKDSDDQLACIGMCVGKINSNGIVIPISVIKDELGISQFCDFRTKHLSEQIQEINKEIKMMNRKQDEMAMKLDKLLSRK